MSFGINILFEKGGCTYVPLPNFEECGIRDYIKEITLVKNSIPVNFVLNQRKEVAMTNLRNAISEKNKTTFESLNTNYISDISQLFTPGFEFNSCDDYENECKLRRTETLDLSKWDARHIQNMQRAFSGLSKIRYLDISTWDLSALIDSKGVFDDSSIEFIWCRDIDAMQKLIEKSSGTIDKINYTFCVKYL